MSKHFEAAKYICSLLQKANFQAVFAGGCVRDSFLGEKYNDIDIATSATADEVVEIMLINKLKVKIVGEAFSVCLVRYKKYEFEVATFRRDIGCDGRHPSSIIYSSMKEDALRRDFTINAIFYDPIKNQFFDFVGGIKDIQDKKLRFVGDAEKRIKEDYIRILRFVRFWNKGFSPDTKTIKIVNDLSNKLPLFVSPDRISKEIITKLFSSIHDVPCMFHIMNENLPNLFAVLFPEVFYTKGIKQNPEHHPEGDVFEHTMELIKNICCFDVSPLTVLAGLYHDTGKAYTTIEVDGVIKSPKHEKESVRLAKDFMKRNRFSEKDISYVCGIIEDHMKFHFSGMKVSTIRKLMAKDYFEDLLIHVYADCVASKGNTKVIEEYSKIIEEIKKNNNEVLPSPIITGNILIDIGYKPGPAFKPIIEEMYDLQLEGLFSSLSEGINIVKEKYSVK